MADKIEEVLEAHESTPKSSEVRETDWEAAAVRLKAEARKWEARAKENKGASDELQKLKESQMSEVDKARAEAEAARKEADDLKVERDRAHWVSKVAKASGVPADVLSSVSAASEDDLAEKAETMKSYFVTETVPVVGGDGNHPAKVASEKQEFARVLFGQN